MHMHREIHTTFVALFHNRMQICICSVATFAKALVKLLEWVEATPKLPSYNSTAYYLRLKKN